MAPASPPLPPTRVFLQSSVRWLSLSFKDVCSMIHKLTVLEAESPSEATQSLLALLESHPILSAISHLEPGTTSLKDYFVPGPSAAGLSGPAGHPARKSRGDNRRGPIRETTDTEEEGAGQRDHMANQRVEGLGEGEEKGDSNQSVTWSNMAKPPRVTPEVSDLVFRLANVHGLGIQKRLSAFLSRLASAPSIAGQIQQEVTVRQLFTRCMDHERDAALHDFLHMVDLIRLATYLESSSMSIQAIAEDNGYSAEQVREWRRQGTRLVVLSAAASFYIVVVIAVLGLKSTIIYRTGNNPTTIMFLANVLRNPGMYDLALAEVVRKRIVPTIHRLYHDKETACLFRFPVHSPTLDCPKPRLLDFGDLSSMENFGNHFQTNYFRLPYRSPIWSAVRPFGTPDWTVDKPCSEVRQIQMPTDMPVLSEPKVIDLSLNLEEVRSVPFKKDEQKRWTTRERELAENAEAARDLEDLEVKLEDIYLDGKKVEGKYVAFSSDIIKGQSIKLNAAKEKLTALLVSDSSGWLSTRLEYIEDLLHQLMPKTMQPRARGTRNGAFKSIHCDIWNRYAEKGTGSPCDVHPDCIAKEGVRRVNNVQRTPYLSETLKSHPKTAQALDDALAEICAYVDTIIRTHLPSHYVKIKAFVDVLPLNHSPTSYPFGSFAINIQVFTDAHVDGGDNSICVTIPFGKSTGGAIVLHEAGLVLELSVGDVVVFPSCYLTHFNLDFDGVRCSIVMFSDHHGQDWVRFRNGWSHHMVVKEF